MPINTLATQTKRSDFLPNLYSVSAVFFLVMLGELLAVGLVVTRSGVMEFDWTYLGMVSFLVQWVVLTSAAFLSLLRPWFKRNNAYVSGMASYSIVLGLTLVFSQAGYWVVHREMKLDLYYLLDNLIIAAIFSGIVLRYFYLQQQLLNQQQAELRARLQSLQSRIRPHFLFNSLNTIASLISFDSKTAERMVEDLADLFRVSLSEPGLVSIEAEIRLTEQFIGMEKLRLDKRLEVVWRIKDEKNVAATTSSPSLLLQPLVENAIYHGIQPLSRGGTVHIDIELSSQWVDIRISNPVAEKTIPVVDVEHKGNGIGLENIMHRLQAHYGNKASVTFESSEELFVINVRYPLVVLAKES
ncbi:sensor histidine kinase [Teredinibacter sp. KSP-S5-2]|uniref:sensor histidine kinase n=1 Tax=Teredinibacter sp. KSP-S5-2 TaxID=3034506 RepID=UPI002934BEB5|nr:histidine kinase [Teredinibacter sp. KSP-S5-2]WNO09323.1 histidine kinase [Teredinibacter sp. KSP-S5-2]